MTKKNPTYYCNPFHFLPCYEWNGASCANHSQSGCTRLLFENFWHRLRLQFPQCPCDRCDACCPFLSSQNPNPRPSRRLQLLVSVCLSVSLLPVDFVFLPRPSPHSKPSKQAHQTPPPLPSHPTSPRSLLLLSTSSSPFRSQPLLILAVCLSVPSSPLSVVQTSSSSSKEEEEAEQQPTRHATPRH